MALKQKKIIGIDVGNKTMQMVVSNGAGKIKRAISYELPDGVIAKMRVDTPELFIKAIKTAKKLGHISGDKGILTLGGTEVIIRHLLLPLMDDAQIYENVKNEISSYLPVDVENFSVDYSIQEEIILENVNQIKVIVVAIPKEPLATYMECFKKAGIRIVSIDITENSEEKIVRYLLPTFDEPPVNFGIIDIGAETTNITTYLDGRFFVNKVANIGGAALTNNLAATLDVDTLAAETSKLGENFFESTASTRAIVTDFADEIIFESSRVFDYFKSRNQLSIERVFLCGGGSVLEGLTEYLQSNINIEVSTFEEIMAPMFLKRPIIPNCATYTAAVGATFREV